MPHEARTAARKAAQRSGVPMGTWIGRAIQEAAQEDLKGPATPAPRLEDTLAKLVETMQATNSRLEKLEAKDMDQPRRGILGRLLGGK